MLIDTDYRGVLVH